MVAKLIFFLLALFAICAFVGIYAIPHVVDYLETRLETKAEMEREEREQVDELVETAEDEYWEQEE